MKQGKILVMEGTDCSGKETQTKLLLKRLVKDKIPCEKMSFPRYNTPTGRIIGQCYLGKESFGEGDLAWFGDANKVNPLIASLYYASDRIAALPDILKIINSGKHLILDRWVESNMGHQAGKERDIKKRIKTINFIHNLEYTLLKLPKPDSVIFLYMPYKIGIELKKNRKGSADGHESNINHLKNAEETYLQLAKKYNWIKINCALNGSINSLRTPEDISDEVYNNIKKMFYK